MSRLQLPSGASRYGADMGRVSRDLNLDDRLGLRRVYLNGGGYDAGGAYWGIGQPLYQVRDEAGNVDYFRAADRPAAKLKLASIAGKPLRFWR